MIKNNSSITRQLLGKQLSPEEAYELVRVLDLFKALEEIDVSKIHLLSIEDIFRLLGHTFHITQILLEEEVLRKNSLTNYEMEIKQTDTSKDKTVAGTVPSRRVPRKYPELLNQLQVEDTRQLIRILKSWAYETAQWARSDVNIETNPVPLPLILYGGQEHAAPTLTVEERDQLRKAKRIMFGYRRSPKQMNARRLKNKRKVRFRPRR
jgi:hypothetical protein